MNGKIQNGYIGQNPLFKGYFSLCEACNFDVVIFCLWLEFRFKKLVLANI
jgi:hypothetical protein